MPRRKINYPKIKEYILALGQIVPEETKLEEFVKVLCGLLHEKRVVRFNKYETHRMLLPYSAKVLKNNGFTLRKKQLKETYFVDGKVFIKRLRIYFIYKPQEE